MSSSPVVGPSLGLRSVLAVALLVGFYALALGIAGGLLYIPYAEWQHLGRVHLKIALVCVVGAGIIVWSIVPRPDRFEPPGPEITPARYPRLHEEIRRIAAATGQEMPASIYLVHELNAFVTERGGVMGFGSRRVMGIGLPLLAAFRVSQLRAVLAHEFGHFHGGDTKLGPWIYKTRAAIERTVDALTAADATVLHRPFVWYGTLFLRVTQAISRRQELAADALAARTVGARPTIEGFERLAGAGPAWSAYWGDECVPVLEAGYRPPLAAGFAEFCRRQQERIAEVAGQRLAAAAASPYDSHPPLGERIAALRALPPGDVATDDRPALELLEDPDAAERDLLAWLSNGEPLAAIAWAEVGSRVYAPAWSEVVQGHGGHLVGLTAATVPLDEAALEELGGRLFGDDAPLVPAGAKVARGANLVATAVAAILVARGFVPEVLPGERLVLRRGDEELAPFALLAEVATGARPAGDWREAGVRLGIGEVPLDGAPAAAVA